MPKKTAVARYLASIGRKGGSASSAAKVAAARANGLKGGGVPRLPKAVRLERIRARITAGQDITPAQAALHYADQLGEQDALDWARRHKHSDWWDAVVAQLERGVR